ncbi:MAG: sigma-70 family RNA polymerase sigma factor [Ignavibacteria bacterium]|nr:sigma-70 family RNA polymerase sigma factor [Ignavibacteria bacterium]
MKENIICSDSDILNLLRSADETDNDKGLNCLYRNCSKAILKFIAGNNGTEDDAKDIIQDAVIIFYEKVKSKDLLLECSISTYMYSVCRNLWLNKIKHSKRFLNDVSDYISVDENIMEGIDNDSRDKEFVLMFNELGESCREILLYYYYERLSMKEIMSKMNFKSEQTTKNKKHKCLNYLRKIVYKNKNFKKHFGNG